MAMNAASPSATTAAKESGGDKAGVSEGNIGWDSHVPVAAAPATLVRGLEGDESMRRKFEAMCRDAQNSICAAIEEVSGVKEESERQS
jgi:coproporphyrinogen III oxidase